MTYRESTAPGINGDFVDDLPTKKVVEKLTKNPDETPQTITLDLSTSLEVADPTARDELDAIGVNGELVTKIESEGEAFYIVRLRPQDYDAKRKGYAMFGSESMPVAEKSPKILETQSGEQPLVLIHFRDHGEDKPALTARAIHRDSPTHVGREIPSDLDVKAKRFDLRENMNISRKHFNLLRKGDDAIELNVTSLYPTIVSYGERATGTVDDESQEQSTESPRKKKGLLRRLANPGLKKTVTEAVDAPVELTPDGVPKSVQRVTIIDPTGKEPAKTRHYRNW